MKKNQLLFILTLFLALSSSAVIVTIDTEKIDLPIKPKPDTEKKDKEEVKPSNSSKRGHIHVNVLNMSETNFVLTARVVVDDLPNNHMTVRASVEPSSNVTIASMHAPAGKKFNITALDVLLSKDMRTRIPCEFSTENLVDRPEKTIDIAIFKDDGQAVPSCLVYFDYFSSSEKEQE